MSRSYRKTPISSITKSGNKAGNQKKWKKTKAKKERKRINNILIPQNIGNEKIEEGYLDTNKKSDLWDSPSDGRYYVTDKNEIEKAKRK